MGCISNSAQEDEGRNSANMHSKRIHKKSENGQIELMNIGKDYYDIGDYGDSESSRSILIDHDEKQIEYITPEGHIEDHTSNRSDYSSDDDILKDGAMTMEMMPTDECNQMMDHNENVIYDAMLHSVEHPGDLKINSSGLMIWNIQNRGNRQWKDCDLLFISGDALSVSVYQVPNLKPNETAALSIIFDTFCAVGMYQSVFRLRTGDGIEFGPHLIISINVTH